jgi:uncharacterized protein (TIGR00251 family)
LKRIKVKVKPNSRSNEIKELDKDYYEVKVSVPPEKGKANKKVIELLSKYFKIPKSRITIISGELFKEKVIGINN